MDFSNAGLTTEIETSSKCTVVASCYHGVVSENDRSVRPHLRWFAFILCRAIRVRIFLSDDSSRRQIPLTTSLTGCHSLHVANVTGRFRAVGNPKKHQQMELPTVARTANLRIDAIDKGIETQADQKHHSGEYSGRQRGVMISAEEGLQRSAQEPDLHDQKNCDQ